MTGGDVSERTAGRDIKIILGMMAVVAVPVLLTLATVRVTVREADPTANPTPYGYTVSLLLFIVPVLAVGVWHLLYGSPYDKKAFFSCAALMSAIGVFLDLAFGYAFFEFPNQGATLGIRVPAWDWATLAWIPDYLPLEEFGFYLLGAVFMVATYLWADRNWVSRMTPEAYTLKAQAHPRILQISPVAAAVWVGLLAYGIIHKYLLDGGFPEYYMFLMAAGVLPSLVLVRTVKEFVNWHALAFTLGGLVFLSVIWEATLAVPYGWWTYRADRMLGFYFHAWANLPVEAVILWLIGVWDAVMFYELFRILHRMEDRKARHALFGVPDAKKA